MGVLSAEQHYTDRAIDETFQGSPVAVTLQITVNIKLELPGKVAKLKPVPCMVAIEIGALGQIAPPLALQVTDVQSSPALETSLTIVPSAAAGPSLKAVTV